MRDQLRAYLSRELDNKNSQISSKLKYVDSKQNTLVQLADMVAGSIASACSGKDDAHFNVLKTRGKIDDLWEFK